MKWIKRDVWQNDEEGKTDGGRERVVCHRMCSDVICRKIEAESEPGIKEKKRDYRKRDIKGWQDAVSVTAWEGFGFFLLCRKGFDENCGGKSKNR